MDIYNFYAIWEQAYSFLAIMALIFYSQTAPEISILQQCSHLVWS